MTDDDNPEDATTSASEEERDALRGIAELARITVNDESPSRTLRGVAELVKSLSPGSRTCC